MTETLRTKPRRKHKKRPYRPDQSIVAAYVPPELKTELYRTAAEKGVPASHLIRQGVSLVLGITGDGPAAVALNDNTTTRRLE